MGASDELGSKYPCEMDLVREVSGNKEELIKNAYPGKTHQRRLENGIRRGSVKRSKVRCWLRE